MDRPGMDHEGKWAAKQPGKLDGWRMARVDKKKRETPGVVCQNTKPAARRRKMERHRR